MKHAALTPPPHRQQGIALIMAIILLVIASIAGLSGIRKTSLQEKLAGNLYDRAIALQAAELAMQAAEKRIVETARDTLIASVPNCSTADSTCLAIPANTFQSDATGWTSVDIGSFNQSLKASSNPQYLIQYLGLKTSNASTGTGQSANPLQYGATGGGSDNESPANATYRIIARSSQPTTHNDRSIAVVSSLFRGN